MANLQTGFTTFLALPLSAGATTATLGTVPTATQGRLHLYDGAQEERVSYTGVSGVTVTGLTRNLSQTADPATGGTGLTWIAGTPVDFVAMHDQIVDKTGSNTFATGTIQTFPDIAFTGTTTTGLTVKSLTTAQRTATTPSNGAIVYDSTLAVHYQYIGGVWTTFATAGATPASTTTSLGGTELATQAENTAGTASGSVGPLTVTPDILATTIQRGERLYAGASATANDTYVVTMTPALAAYTTGMQISFKTDVANTGACSINVNGLGAKSIKLIDGTDPLDGDLPAGKFINLQYDGTNMVYDNTLLRSTAAQANTGTDTKTALTPSLLIYAGSTPIAGTDVTVASLTTERSQTGTTYTQKYIGTMLRTGTYTVSFGLSRQNGGAGGTAYGRIYKNGVAFGTEQSTTSAYSSFVTKTENLAFTAGDTISLWLKAGVPASDIAYANNFLVTCSQPQFTIA